MIVGTAGHIDHGKTSLVHALTGTDTDRLLEEKARGITIDLGFAWVPVPGAAEPLGFVDVPGHERLVHTMIAGAASIDVALLVVAADDGVMPQTREHLQVLDLLGIRRGLVALTKADLADAACREAVASGIRATLAGTGLAGAEILPVSAATGEGVAALRERLLTEARAHARRPACGAFRFAVDRSFSLPGAGTVVTGSVLGGRVRVGEEVRVLPAGLTARIRGLHAGNAPVTEGAAGQRCALNLSGPGVHKDAVGRGGWVLDPTRAAASARFDAELRLLEGGRAPLRSWAPVHLHHGAGQAPARVVPLAPEPLPPGGAGLVQIVLDAPRPVRHGDRIVLRDTSARRTIGGGRVLDPRAPERRRRSPVRLALLAALREEAGGDPAAEGLARLLALPPWIVDLEGFAADRGLTAEERDRAAGAAGALRLEGGGHVARQGGLAQLRAEVEAALAAFHAKNPEQPGMGAPALRAALPTRLPPPAFAALLAWLAGPADAVVVEQHRVRLPSHVAVGLGPVEQALWDRLLALLSATPYRPPPLRAMAAALRVQDPALRRACKRFARAGRLVEVAPDRFVLRPALAEMAAAARELSEATGGAFTAAQFRDRLKNGRGVAIEVLEYLDRRGITLRSGDLRRVAKDPAALFGPAGGAW
jgi:selenocysteine-specific elongation factor